MDCQYYSLGHCHGTKPPRAALFLGVSLKKAASQLQQPQVLCFGKSAIHPAICHLPLLNTYSVGIPKIEGLTSFFLHLGQIVGFLSVMNQSSLSGIGLQFIKLTPPIIFSNIIHQKKIISLLIYLVDQVLK